MINLGYSFYHSIGGTAADFGRGIVNRSKNPDLQTGLFKVEGALQLGFEILYPGLIIGLGYEHPKLKKENDDFALGFMFDHTTGLPYIPGSGVKGVIRSAFPNSEEDTGRLEFINGILDKNLSYENIKNIETQIFGHRTGDNKNVSKQLKDTFYDGYVSLIAARSGPLLGEEYITPHGKAITNPVPIKLLKIMPGHEITLQFGLNQDKKCLLSPKEKRKLFAEIILTIGLGAKTNVGFGQFDYDFTARELGKLDRAEPVTQIELDSGSTCEDVLKKYDLDREEVKEDNIVKLIQEMQKKEKSEIPLGLNVEIAKKLQAIMKDKGIWKIKKKNKAKERVEFLKTFLPQTS